jgi:hypothetical protein
MPGLQILEQGLPLGPEVHLLETFRRHLLLVGFSFRTREVVHRGIVMSVDARRNYFKIVCGLHQAQNSQPISGQPILGNPLRNPDLHI